MIPKKYHFFYCNGKEKKEFCGKIITEIKVKDHKKIETYFGNYLYGKATSFLTIYDVMD